MPLADKLVQLAVDQVGIREIGSNQGPPITKYAGGREEPWCAHFLAWLFRTCGAPLPGDIEPSVSQHNPIAKVSTMWGNLVRDGYQVGIPRPGDIVAWSNRLASDKGTGWHCGLVTAVEHDMGQSIDGNWRDGVERHRWRTHEKHIVGLRA